MIPISYSKKPTHCDGTHVLNLPVAHMTYRRCKATGDFYWTVDADPHQYCPKHEPKEPDREIPF